MFFFFISFFFLNDLFMPHPCMQTPFLFINFFPLFLSLMNFTLYFIITLSSGSNFLFYSSRVRGDEFGAGKKCDNDVVVIQVLGRGLAVVVS